MQYHTLVHAHVATLLGCCHSCSTTCTCIYMQHMEDRNLLVGHLAMYMEQYSEAQDLFLTSSNPMAALEVLSLPTLLSCRLLCPPSTYTPFLSLSVSSLYLYSFPVSCVLPLRILLPCLLCPPSTYTPSLSPVSSLYLYSFPVSCVLPLPILLPCLFLYPLSTYTPSLSPVSSLYLYSFPVSCVLPLLILLPCLLCPPSTYTPSLSPVLPLPTLLPCLVLCTSYMYHAVFPLKGERGGGGGGGTPPPPL